MADIEHRPHEAGGAEEAVRVSNGVKTGKAQREQMFSACPQ